MFSIGYLVLVNNMLTKNQNRKKDSGLQLK